MKSPYKQGAEDGLLFGLYLGVMVFSVIFSTMFPALSLPVLILFVLTPVFIFARLRRYYVAEKGLATTSALWMQGLVMSACGALLAFVSAYVYMRWVNPGYLDAAYQEGIKSMIDSGIPEIEEYARQIDSVTGGHNIVSPIDFCLGMIWTTILGGSIVSLFAGLIVGLIPVSRRKRS